MPVLLGVVLETVATVSTLFHKESCEILRSHGCFWQVADILVLHKLVEYLFRVELHPVERVLAVLHGGNESYWWIRLVVIQRHYSPLLIKSECSHILLGDAVGVEVRRDPLRAKYLDDLGRALAEETTLLEAILELER